MRVRLVFILSLLAVAAAAQTTFELAAGAGGVAGGGLGASGGFWPAASATVMLNRKVGINADFEPRGQRVTGPGYSYDAWLADVGLAVRPVASRIEPEIDVGWGLKSTGSTVICPVGPAGDSGCSTQSSVRVGLHLGFAAVINLSQHLFFRPIYHLYLGQNIDHVSYIGVMLGYSFGGH